MPEIPVVPALWRFPAHPASVARARHAVAEVLPRQLHAELGLITSELVTNAVRYGAGADDLVELVLWPADGHYWLAVSDPGDGKPVLDHRPPPDAESGRGLLLVDALAAAWGVVQRPYRGKSVVAGLALPA
ncbi:ATP-binding protein [Streptomyces cocklensis]|jgi:two-component sensor histidine kinase|uniref:Anti-sigma regulatory factor (Ser/Thr protein kinase) n=1 Tax=Actinacidiphila cocklensis TaxID=887465 RepID=A0A9W4EAI5_9ACTN|nr:ATP-binding protein [Actinacidiphila cocklensis]MDD1056878.1 ATP-binding protein [Actinacidiphila cocklensis]WSX78024.1 ATP-binding protein [Streptomyces sp. NBC_00899]CAG6397380.1 Anti-sigma regulatory factor (Ser/Thr protein kinase) [Actinacidiphila cocklensis]